MNMTDPLFNHPHDHIMANTWRLIFERKPQAASTSALPALPTDAGMLEQVLSEYRLIGLTLAENDKNRLLD
ncbi:MAG: hypothetical protein AB1801_13710 [Chloroflexota bacterium]